MRLSIIGSTIRRFSSLPCYFQVFVAIFGSVQIHQEYSGFAGKTENPRFSFPTARVKIGNTPCKKKMLASGDSGTAFIVRKS